MGTKGKRISTRASREPSGNSPKTTYIPSTRALRATRCIHTHPYDSNMTSKPVTLPSDLPIPLAGDLRRASSTLFPSLLPGLYQPKFHAYDGRCNAATLESLGFWGVGDETVALCSSAPREEPTQLAIKPSLKKPITTIHHSAFIALGTLPANGHLQLPTTSRPMRGDIGLNLGGASVFVRYTTYKGLSTSCPRSWSKHKRYKHGSAKSRLGLNCC